MNLASFLDSNEQCELCDIGRYSANVNVDRQCKLCDAGNPKRRQVPPHVASVLKAKSRTAMVLVWDVNRAKQVGIQTPLGCQFVQYAMLANTLIL